MHAVGHQTVWGHERDPEWARMIVPLGRSFEIITLFRTATFRRQTQFLRTRCGWSRAASSRATGGVAGRPLPAVAGRLVSGTSLCAILEDVLGPALDA